MNNLRKTVIEKLRDNPAWIWKVRLNAVFIFIISCSSIAGHILNKPQWYMWGAQLGMGLPTAVAFILTSSAFLAITWEADRE